MGSKVIWKDERVYFPLEMGDQEAIINNQKISKVRFENLTNMYRDGLEYIASKLLGDEIPPSRIKKAIKEI